MKVRGYAKFTCGATAMVTVGWRGGSAVLDGAGAGAADAGVDLETLILLVGLGAAGVLRLRLTTVL